jgi:hypothetical protein
MVSIDFVLCCKSLNMQSSGVQERINPFYINSYGENSFGLQMTFRNELSLWTEVWLYIVLKQYNSRHFLTHPHTMEDTNTMHCNGTGFNDMGMICVN